MQRHPKGETIPILVQPVIIVEGLPEVWKIYAAIRKLWLGREGGPLSMKAEQFKEWLRAATREKDPDTETWERVVSVIHIAFREGYILEALT